MDYDNEIYDIDEDQDIIDFAVEIMNDQNENEQVSKKLKLSQDEYDKIEMKCIHKIYGCQQCRNKYVGNVDLNYHEKLNIIFNKVKNTINRTVN